MVHGSNGNGYPRVRNGGRHANGHEPGNGGDQLHHRSRLRSRRRRRLEQRGYRSLLVFVTIAGIGALAVCLAVLLVAIHGAATAYASLNRDLPSVNQISSRESFKTAQVFDRKGTLLWEFYDQDGGKRTIVPLSEISPHLINAQLAAEDANFYSNPGVDLRSIARALFQNVSEQDIVSGGSTITQQLVRNVLMKPEERHDRSMARKLKEGLLAYQATKKLSKPQILALYMNEIYYGNLAYGVEAASQTYFGKRARELTLAESAVIAGLPQAPSQYDPVRNPVGAKARQSYVLDQMARNGFITEQEAEQAKQAELRYQPQKQVFLAPHWVMYVRDLMEAKYGPKLLHQGGWKIHTTLDLDLQRTLEEVARGNAETLARSDANNTSITVINPKTGEILAMVGSMDYWNSRIEGQVNVATSERQPGSTIKPLVYLAAFGKGYTPATTVVDEKISIPDDLGRVWTPENFDRRFRGPVSVRAALGNSLNIPAVKVLQFAGIDTVADVATRAGITTWADRRRLGPAMSLGGAEVRPLEITAAYAVLANNGLKIPPVAITKLIDADGSVIEDYKVPQGEQLVDPRYPYMLTSILSDNNARLVTFGPNSMLNSNRPTAVKTGTTDNYRDTWAIGYTPNIAVGVWVGNTDNHPMREVLSSMSAGKVWREAMDTTLDFLKLPPEDFVRPPGLVDAEVCGDLAMRPGQPPCYRDLFPAERAPANGRVFLEGYQTPPAPAPVRTVVVPSGQPGAPQQGVQPTSSSATPGPAATAQPQPTSRTAPPTRAPSQSAPPPQATPGAKPQGQPKPQQKPAP